MGGEPRRQSASCSRAGGLVARAGKRQGGQTLGTLPVIAEGTEIERIDLARRSHAEACHRHLCKYTLRRCNVFD